MSITLAHSKEIKNTNLLLAALQKVEWVQDIEEHGLYCPWCLAVKTGGHFEDCQRQKAIAAVLNPISIDRFEV